VSEEIQRAEATEPTRSSEGDEVPRRLIAIFPKVPANQYATEMCLVCGVRGNVLVTPIRFGGFFTGAVVTLCDPCLKVTVEVVTEATNGDAK
jgi:hypothetical protein